MRARELGPREAVIALRAQCESHGARIGRTYAPEESEARARLAEIMIPAVRAFRWAKDSPEFASLPSDHPMREFARVVGRLMCRQSITELVRAAEAATIAPEAVEQTLRDATPRERERAAISIIAARGGK